MFKNFPNDRQLDLMDCGPACLKMIAKHYGRYFSLQHLRHKCGTTKEGTSIFDLSHGAESIGFRTMPLKCGIDDLLRKIPLPAVAHWNDSHFIVIYKTDPVRNRVFVSDPAKGRIDYSAAEFVAGWIKANEPTGFLMAVEPGAEFWAGKGEQVAERRKTFDSIFGYFTPYRKSFFQLMGIMLIVTVVQAFLPFLSKAVIDIGIQTHDREFINIVLVANMTILVSILFCNMTRDWILLHISARVNIALISDYLIKLMVLPVTFFESKMTGDILQRANDHERIRSFIMNNSLSMVFSTITFILFGIILLFYNVAIFGIFLSGSLLYVAWVLVFLKLRRKLDYSYFDLVSKNQSYWVETIANIQDIKLNNYEQQKRWKWEQIQASLFKVNLRMLRINNIQNSGAQFIDSSKNLLITFFCAKAVIAGEMSFGVMISTQFIIGMLNAPVVQLIGFIMNFQVAKISFLRLNEIHQLKDEHEDVGSQTTILPNTRHLFVRNISFRYTPAGKPVLNNVQVVIPQGHVTAIVGDSGSGKSTLLKLILRLYDPSSGEILMGNTNVNNIPKRQWRQMCGAVMQDGAIFNDTVLNNIVMGDERIDYNALSKAVSAANIGSEIEQMQRGYHTVLGERGRGLSGGQRQRLLIARALYKDPEYLFFDEATNALDTINEQKIVDSLDQIFRGKTVVVVAHRLSTIRKASQIIVMQQGSVVEMGRHDDLIAKGGRYAQLIRAQVENSTKIGVA